MSERRDGECSEAQERKGDESEWGKQESEYNVANEGVRENSRRSAQLQVPLSKAEDVLRPFGQKSFSSWTGGGKIQITFRTR